jgi:alpha-amylase/alpha-mannosidase (GH57 family)
VAQLIYIDLYMEQLLHNLYYDPETGYSSADKLYRKAKQQDPKITMKIVKEFINTQSTAQITKQVKIKIQK